MPRRAKYLTGAAAIVIAAALMACTSAIKTGPESSRGNSHESSSRHSAAPNDITVHNKAFGPQAAPEINHELKSKPELTFAPLQIKAPRASRAETELCIAIGGAVLAQGLAGHDMCVRPYQDAGKICTDSAQCLGQCRTDGFKSAGHKTAGTCQGNSSPFGCYTQVKGGMAEPTLCVD